MNINEFWKAVIAQDEQEIRKYFREDAYINWHCTNEHFNLDEYIIANCEYPGEWDGVVERIEEMDDLLVTVARVYLKDKSISFHVTSFAKIVDERIASLDEYWADDSDVPRWRMEKNIGTAIK